MDEVLATPQFERTLAELAAATGRPVDALRTEAQADLKEMAAIPGRFSVTAWDAFSRWLSRAYQLDYSVADVERLRELNRGTALIFLPNHRSYLDPLVLRSALEQHGFPPNNVLGGANLKMWPMSEVGRRNGIVFIRREFRDDPVYKAVLKAYLAHLISTKQNLEWYIEGGRTRTGKLRPPRYGVLGYVMDAFTDQPDHDVRIVPTSIVYDQQHEVGAISAEEMGGTKKPESLGWLYRFARSQSRRLGRAHLRFGRPLSLGDAVSLTLDDEGTPRPRQALPRVALEVMHRINEVTPVTPSALVTFALLDNGDRAITAEEGRSILEPLLAYVRRRKLPMTGSVTLERKGPLRDALDQLVTEGVVQRYDGGTERVFYVELEHQHEAAFYRNTIIHWFVNRAITELALLQAAEDEAADVVTATWYNARRLKEILSYEFSFPTTMEFAGQVAAETSLVYPGWEQEDFTAQSALAHLRTLELVLAHRVVGPFLEAYAILAADLAALDAAAPVDEAALVERSLGVARQLWLQKRIHSAESISRDYFRNAVQLARHEGLLDEGSPDLGERRAQFAAELAAAVRRVDELRRIAKTAGQPVLTERAPILEGGDRG